MMRMTVSKIVMDDDDDGAGPENEKMKSQRWFEVNQNMNNHEWAGDNQHLVICLHPEPLCPGSRTVKTDKYVGHRV